MADTKISALTVATTPLAGTEVLPIVQSGVTKQVSVANLTAGRAVSALSLTLTNALTVGNGGTGQTTFTAGYIPYGAGSGALGSTSNLFWNTSTNTLQIPYIGVNTTYQSGYFAAINGDIWVGNSGGVQIGSIKNNGGWFDFQGSANVNGVQISTATNLPARVVINGTETWRFDTSQNITQQVASKGINFTANTAAAGKTSQLLNWYEEGSWTPSDQSGAGLTFTTADGYYTRIGRMVYASFYITYPVTVNASNNAVGGLPFTAANTNAARGGSALTYSEFNTVSSIYGPKNNTLFSVTDGVGNSRTNAVMSGKTIMGCIIYFT